MISAQNLLDLTRSGSKPSQDSEEHMPTKLRIYLRRGIIAFFLAIFLLVIIKDAWISDDGYITLRTVWNFIHGYGLTWNIDERVQAYTHPLWMFLLSGTAFCLRNIYLSDILLSLIISGLTAALFAFRIAKSSLTSVVSLALLAASKSFADFSTSGLENPLTHLLIVLFVLAFFQDQQSKRYFLWLSLLGCMMILNRMDTVLLFLPALFYALYQSSHKLRALRTMLLAFLPFILWELFSLFYYGSLFPNTAYAKLNTGLSNVQLFQQGLAYLLSSSAFDPLLCIILILGVIIPIMARDWKSIPLLLGMGLYIAYVVKVGGDFMAGRFLTPPFLMAVILLVRNIPSTAKTPWLVIGLTAILFGFLIPNSRWLPLRTISLSSKAGARALLAINSKGIADEHLFYAGSTDLIAFSGNLFTPITPNWYTVQWAQRTQQAHQHVVVFNALGYFGYEVGPQVHVVDNIALSDPLLARLPMNSTLQGNWRIGHVSRIIPAGYLETLETGVNKIQDPNLAQYYTHLHDIVSGPLFSWQRIVEIRNLNIGSYNGLINQYIQSLSTHCVPRSVQNTFGWSYSVCEWRTKP